MNSTNVYLMKTHFPSFFQFKSVEKPTGIPWPIDRPIHRSIDGATDWQVGSLTA